MQLHILAHLTSMWNTIKLGPLISVYTCILRMLNSRISQCRFGIGDSRHPFGSRQASNVAMYKLSDISTPITDLSTLQYRSTRAWKMALASHHNPQATIKHYTSVTQHTCHPFYKQCRAVINIWILHSQWAWEDFASHPPHCRVNCGELWHKVQAFTYDVTDRRHLCNLKLACLSRYFAGPAEEPVLCRWTDDGSAGWCRL